MLLGIFLHVGLALSPNSQWVIQYVSSANWISWLVNFIHQFRMPTFFIISGYFATMLVRRYRWREFVKTRTMRLLIPLLTTAIVFNSIQEYLLIEYMQKSFDFSDYMHFGWVSHLWFLINLFIYLILFKVVFSAFLRNWYEYIHIHFGSKALSNLHWFWVIIASGFLGLLLPALNKIGIPVYDSLPIIKSVYMLFYYAPFFLIGTLLYLCPFFEKASLKQGFALFSAGVLSFCIIRLQSASGSEGWAETIFLTYFSSLSSFALSFGILSICNHLMRQGQGWSRCMFDASYTIYLIHHLLVIVFIIALTKVGYELSATFAFVLISTLTFVSAYLFHHKVIKKLPYGSFFMNGKSL